jgi:hypothetical protein
MSITPQEKPPYQQPMSVFRTFAGEYHPQELSEEISSSTTPFLSFLKKFNLDQPEQFSFTATVPGGMLFSTAIGSIVARYQVLNFSCNMGCCANDPTC